MRAAAGCLSSILLNSDGDGPLLEEARGLYGGELSIVWDGSARNRLLT
jgi:hypothetical protein